MIEFTDAYTHRLGVDLLYSLLLERSLDEGVNISHNKAPNYDDHAYFVRSQPYYLWLLIYADGICVGAISVTYRNEIGIFIYRDQQGRGYGKAAIVKLLETYRPLPARHASHGGQFVANINPANARSIGIFEGLGFEHIQNTYELKADG